jgi:hypothetical protein
MASTWASHWLEQELEADFERHFNKEQDKDSSLTLYFKVIVFAFVLRITYLCFSRRW